MLQAVLGELQYGIAIDDQFSIIVDAVGTVLMETGGAVKVGIEVEL